MRLSNTFGDGSNSTDISFEAAHLLDVRWVYEPGRRDYVKATILALEKVADFLVCLFTTPCAHCDLWSES